MTAKSTAMQPNEYTAVMSPLLGLTLEEVVMTRYFHPPSGGVSDQDLFLRLDSVGWVGFRTASDGYGLRIDVGPAPEPADMQELGHVAPVSVASDDRFTKLLHATLDAVSLISLPWATEPIGLALGFGTGTVVIIDWGDELLVANELPNYVIDGDGRPAVIGPLPL
jgi:hypothetical protein